MRKRRAFGPGSGIGGAGSLYNVLFREKGERERMTEKEIFCALQVDVDAVAGWLGSYGGADSPDDISRGVFAGEVGGPRLVELFRRYDLTQTFFSPGHSIET